MIDLISTLKGICEHWAEARLVHVAHGEGWEGDVVDPGVYRVKGHQNGTVFPLLDNLIIS